MFTKRENARIFSKISIDFQTQCWNWTGSLSEGYGRAYWRGKRYKAHRLLYLWKFGELPEYRDGSSQELDHICRNKACVNPDHLRIITHKENVLSGTGPTAVNFRKETCAKGHKLVQLDDRRRCKTCDSLYMRSEKRRIYKRKYYKEHYSKNKNHD